MRQGAEDASRPRHAEASVVAGTSPPAALWVQAGFLSSPRAVVCCRVSSRLGDTWVLISLSLLPLVKRHLSDQPATNYYRTQMRQHPGPF